MNQESENVVLVVDDDPASLRMLFEYLRQADFKVLVAENGASAMKRLERSRPDIVLLDVQLPDIDGFELCRRLKDRYPEPDITVMFLTMYADIGDKLKGLNLGAVDYMTKPFQPEEVVARVERHLTLRNLQRSLEERNAQLEHEIAEHKRTEEKLRVSEAKLRALFASLTDVIFVLDQHGRYIDIAPTSPDLLYRPADEVLGKSLHEVFPKQQADVFLDAVHTSLDTRQTVSLEYSLIIGDAELWFDGRLSPMSEDTVVLVARDITEQKQAKEQLQKAKVEAETARRLAEEERAAAQAANRAKSVFLANMSHELRTPLNAILGYAQLMARDPNLRPPQNEYLETITRSGEHLLGLINEVLTMSKIDAGRIAVQNNAFDLHQQLRGLQEIFGMNANKKRLALLVDIAPDVPRYVHADEGKLRQVLMNLVDNAIKFTNEGSVRLRVERHEREPDRGYDDGPDFPDLVQLCFDIEDTGAGIAPEEMKDLFEPFVQTASGQGSQGGTGLGLPISKEFVNLMGGELSANSTVGQGTAFRVQVPVTIATADVVNVLDWQPQRRVVGIEPGQTAPGDGPFRLLVVEDKATNRELLVELLKPLGFQIREAENGKQAIEIAQDFKPHLIWMDIRMPVMDGIEASRYLKATPEGQAMKIIALTASDDEEDREKMNAVGCDDFLLKPVRVDEVLELLSEHLGVEYIYTDSARQQGTSEHTLLSSEEIATVLGSIPEELLIRLREGLEVSDVMAINRTIDEIREYHFNLAEVLHRLAQRFQFDELLVLLGREEQS